MNRGYFPLALLLVGALCSAHAQTSTEVDTIVPPTDQVSEFNARQELVRVLRKLGRIEAAESELRRLLKFRPHDPVLLADLADIEATRGHFVHSRDLYERALSESSNAIDLRLRYARQARSWGDFYLAEKVLRAYLGKHPKDIDAALDLAGVLVAEQQYEAAEAEYRPLTKKPGARQRALIGLATDRLLEKNFQAVLPYTDAVLDTNPEQIDALTLRAEALSRLHRYDEAKEGFRRLSLLPGDRASGWIGLGRLARAQKDEASAEEYFRRAQGSDSKDIRARYLLAGQSATQTNFLHGMVTSRGVTTADLNTLAGLYAEDGHLDSAITLYQEALTKDPEYFPARIGLAQALATAHRYGESIEILNRLHDEFPDNAKIMLSFARVLSWSRRYDDAIRAYRELSALNPVDTVPRKEMARVATWSKQMRLAREVYADIYATSVDQQLIEALQRSHQDQVVLRALDRVLGNGKSPYEKYEHVRQLLDSGQLPAVSHPVVEDTLVDLEPAYRLQKAVWLESSAKWLDWNRKSLQSAHTYRELLALQPGNEEAWFDLAQVEAAQGLSLESAASYRELLELDPSHNLASEALERNDSILQSPALFGKYTFWHEKGIGRASDIERQQFQSGTEFVWNSQTQLRLSGDYWIESPGSGSQADAAGTTVSIRTVFNEFWRASAEWSHKTYLDSRYNDTDTGHGDLTFNAWDYAHLTLQYARVDELHNQFGLQQGVQSDNLGFSLDSDLNHYVEVNSGVVWTHYTDNNQGIWVTLAPAFILHDDPHMLRIILRGDYRDTKYASVFEFQGPQLHNIIHPYWTPQEYTRGSVILEWRHDLSRDFYAGGQQHYYALRLGGGIDSTGNKNVLFEAEWHYDFLRHWALEARGTVDRSPAWNGAAASVSLIYRF
jgi:tetratricopeptide (TPR) repeat protein